MSLNLRNVSETSLNHSIYQEILRNSWFLSQLDSDLVFRRPHSPTSSPGITIQPTIQQNRFSTDQHEIPELIHWVSMITGITNQSGCTQWCHLQSRDLPTLVVWLVSTKTSATYFYFLLFSFCMRRRKERENWRVSRVEKAKEKGIHISKYE